MGERAPDRLEVERVGTAEPAPTDPRERYADPEVFGMVEADELAAWLDYEEQLRRREKQLVASANRELAPHFEEELPTEPEMVSASGDLF